MQLFLIVRKDEGSKSVENCWVETLFKLLSSCYSFWVVQYCKKVSFKIDIFIKFSTFITKVHIEIYDLGCSGMKLIK